MSKRFREEQETTSQTDKNVNVDNENKENDISIRSYENENPVKNTPSKAPEEELRKLEDEKTEVRDIMNSNKGVKKFRFIIGLFLAVSLIYVGFSGGSNKNYQTDLSSGIIQEVEVGDKLSEEAVTLQPIDIEVDLAGQDGGPIKLYLWDFDDEDGDYVQVFVNGMAHTEPFMVKGREVKISVPSKGIIQVKGIRDGDGKGISYGVYFNKTGEKYLNAAPLNGVNTYTLKTTN